ncbi:bifunctional folylpolyglutamate synthase/dihydrofolate synthase [Paenibacillus montaniterrae]|uniref:Dihydrofolate synthase/folylpolyglutamate synthase n=1 Tax=Paenibacillus montaniterrae TaxID=429341 RepID=A0A920CXH5_9BACL|nr:folylpolyglutamate synthase/dihydrofolate synthase family protein [Paenibacillus montaniterrae]GIP16926.1 bifunctional folylpolyglutamate synthase/dihydrofolate synthase [Paenibacillus montaniterrae]
MSHNQANAAMSSYTEAVEWINSLIPFGIRPGLERIEKLLDAFQNPHRRLRIIHVAGTNGKGSVCSYLTHVLRKGGYDVGTFTSPYITKFTNRIQYNGQDIEEEVLLELANQVRPYVEEMAATELGSPTMFEVTTLIAILYYATVTYPDYVVLEVGLGGRLDVTNVVHPIVSVITTIGHDHMDKLGNTLEQIAYEKAGIIKAGTPVVVGVTQPEALRVIQEVAEAKKSTMYVYEQQFDQMPLYVDEHEQQFRFEGLFRNIEDVTITMAGAHQRHNAAIALMTIELLRQYFALVIDDEDLLEGMKMTSWPGRLEQISSKPRLLIDGAHNPEGAQALAQALDSTYQYEKLHLVMGMIENKNHHDTFKHILPLADTLILTEPNYRSAKDADELYAEVKELANELGLQDAPRITVEKDWKQALRLLLERTNESDLAVVTGTLYLIGDVRSYMLHNKDAEKGW